MGSGDIGYIDLNGDNILRFTHSNIGGSLSIYDDTGKLLGNISGVNGKPALNNTTFDVSFIRDGFDMFIEIQKYDRGVPAGTFNYSYLTNKDITVLQTSLAGYQSGVDYISSNYSVEYKELSNAEPMIIEGSFRNLQDFTFQFGEKGYRVERVDLRNLNVSMGSGDIGYIHLNGNNILLFINSNDRLIIYDQTGKQLGGITRVNGKPVSSGNITFDVSFIRDDLEMLIEIQKYDKNVPAGTFSYSYLMGEDISTLRAQFVGYQSNVDCISSEYAIYYEPLPFSPRGSFENEEHKFISLYQKGFDLMELHFTNLRVATGVHDVGSVYLSGREFLRFIDSPAGGTLVVFDGAGNELDSIYKINGCTANENVTFDVSFILLDDSNISIVLNMKENGNFAASYSYVCAFEKSILSAQLHLQGYESSLNYISGAYDTVYALSLESIEKSVTGARDITIPFEKESLDIVKIDLKDLRAVILWNNIGYIYLNDREFLKFVGSNNTLFIYGENGTVLGTMREVNGLASSFNMTFNISLTSNESDTLVKIEKFRDGQPNSTNCYLYESNELVTSMRAYISSPSHIDFSYDVKYEASIYDLPPYEKPRNSFENEGDITIYLENNISSTVKHLNLNGLRIHSNLDESAYIALNDNDILRLENTASGKSLVVLDSTGNTIGTIESLNSSKPYENTTFNVFFNRDNQTTYQTTIHIETYEEGVVTGTYQYTYDLNEPFSSLRAYVDTFDSDKSFVSSSFDIFCIPSVNYTSENDGPSDFITYYSYDSMDRIIQKTLPNGKVINYNYNNQTLLSSIPGVIDNIEYDSMNLMTRKSFSNGKETELTYDSQTKRLENIYTPGLQNLNYAFDPKGNVIGITDRIIGENQYFFYDDLDRLLLAGSENYSQSFAYNPLGSILAHRSKDMTTNEEIIFGFEYGNNAGIHAPTRVGEMNLFYDANGNLIEDGEFIYVYNDANRLTEVLKKSDNNKIVSEFVYDENGKRVKKTENNVISYYITPDYDIKDGEETVYFFANGKRVAKESSEGMFWYLDDHLGSTNVMMDSDGDLVERTLYYPFGGHREGGTEQYTFTGKEFDSGIGLYYFEARYYNPQTFVFTQADSIIPDLYNPQSLNRYSYCYNNPLKYEDPDGHAPIIATAFAGAVIGGALFGGIEAYKQIQATGGISFDRQNGLQIHGHITDRDAILREAAKGAVAGGLAGAGAGVVGAASTAVVGTQGGIIVTSTTGVKVGVCGGIISRGFNATYDGMDLSDAIVVACHPESILIDMSVSAVTAGLSPNDPTTAVIQHWVISYVISDYINEASDQKQEEEISNKTNSQNNETSKK